MPEAPPAAARELAEMERACATAAMAARLWFCFHRIDIEMAAAQIRTPTLVLHSHGDGMVPFTEGRRLAALIPGARFVPLDGRNHILQVGEPAWGHFWREVHDFLAGDAVPPATPRPGLS